MNLKLGFASVAVALLLATGANAATCAINNVYFTLTGASEAQCVAGNDLGNKGIVATDREMFELAGWSLGGSTDASADTDGAVGFAAAPKVKATSGSWSIASSSGLGALMIVLKSGNQFGAFLLQESLASLSGTWNISRDACNKNGCKVVGKALSHASVYHNTPAAVPLPAAGLLLLGALAGFGLLRRTRKTA